MRETLWRGIRRVPAVSRRQIARTGLFVSVALAVLTGLGLALIMTWAIGGAVGIRQGERAAPIEVLKTALAVIAGVGGTVALVVAYRRQRDLEQGRFVERFGAAAAQLGDSDAAVRLAGVYAMAGVADESSDVARRQQCIDVLCGYLRLPYDPEQGRSHRTELVTTTTRPAEPPATSIEEQVHQRLRQNDREVRQTIVRIITAHLRAEAPTNWSGHDYDFTGVLFENARFGGTTFSGEHTWFIDATFSGETTWFDAATFNGESTSFSGAKFSGESTWFTGAKFSGESTRFTGAEFSSKTTWFTGATFSGESTSFEWVTFSGEVVFESPRAWNNVTFDWDYPPECIHPREWPPQVDS